MTTTNDAAERLRALFWVSKTFEAFPVSPAEAEEMLDAALAAERRATVERYEPVLRALLEATGFPVRSSMREGEGTVLLANMEPLLAAAEATRRFLDAEAER